MKTFAQLREELANTRGMNQPSAKRLLEMEDLVVEETGSIKVYQNGFFIYSSNGYRTVFAIDIIKYLKFGDTEFHDLMICRGKWLLRLLGNTGLKLTLRRE